MALQTSEYVYAISDPSPPLLPRQREARSFPPISPIQATPDTSRDTVRDLVCGFPIFVRLMEIDAPLQSHSGWAEVPHGAVKFFRREASRSHGVEEVRPFDVARCRANAWHEEDGFEDFEGASIDRERGRVVVCAGLISVLIIDLRSDRSCDWACLNLRLRLRLQLRRWLFLGGRLLCQTAAVQLKLSERHVKRLGSL